MKRTGSLRSVPRRARRVLSALLVPAALLAAAFSARPASAQSKTGTTMGQFLLIEPNATTAGMGNAGVSRLDGLAATFFNPAAISAETHYSVLFSHSEWLADIAYNYAAVAVPIHDVGTAFASVTSLNSGLIDVRTVSQPLGTGERYSVSDVAIGVGLGRRITDRVSAGVQATFAQETIWHSSANAFTFGLGTLYQVSPLGWSLGASISNFGTDGRFDGRDLRILFDSDPDRFGDNGTLPADLLTDAFPVPVLFRVGAGVPLVLSPASRLRLQVDALHPSDNSESVNAGAEFLYRERFALRAGYQGAFLEDSEMGLTAGGGLAGELGNVGYRLDYAWADHGRLGSAHRLSLQAHF